jgi:protein-S-isoprenylcysteine O-methyltransferase Ste14
MIAEIVVKGAWLTFVLVWVIGAMRTKRDKRSEQRSSRLTFVGLVIFGALLMFTRADFGALSVQIFARSSASDAAAMALVVLGIGLTIWARVVLGQNWSGRVTLKEGHELVERGPYRLVRHPIYTGALLALVGTALAVDELRALIAIAPIFVGMLLKVRLEERWLREEFGARYDAYAARTKALVPFVI